MVMMTSHTTEIVLTVKLTVHHTGGVVGGCNLATKYIQDVTNVLTKACELGGTAIYLDPPEVEIDTVFTVPNK
jgi:hypothetical protein